MKRRSTPLLIAAASLALVAVGCSNDADSNSAAPKGEATTFADNTDPDLDPVKVGIISTIGSTNTDLPESPAALAAGITALNSRGGLNGHRVEMVFCNDKDDPNEGATCARKMVEENVVAMLGAAGSATTAAKVTPIVTEAGIPLLGVESGDPTVWNSKDAYLVAQPAPLNYQALIAYAVKNDLLPMAVAAADNPAGLQFAGFLESTLKDLSGEGFADVVPVADNTSDYAPIAGTLINSKPKSVLNIIGTQQQLGVSRAVKNQGSDAVMLTASPLNYDTLNDLGPAAGNLVMAGPYPPFGADVMEGFRNEMASAEAAGDKDASLDGASSYAAYPWVALQVLEKVAGDLDTITAATIRAALDSVKDIDLDGIVPPWTPSGVGPEGYSRVANPASWFAGFADGKSEALVDSAIPLAELTSGDFESKLPPSLQ